jgi:hypothetical protein
MSDQRLIVPSDTPSACAACEVDRPSGLPWMFLIALFHRVLDEMTRIIPQLHNIWPGTTSFGSIPITERPTCMRPAPRAPSCGEL